MGHKETGGDRRGSFQNETEEVMRLRDLKPIKKVEIIGFLSVCFDIFPHFLTCNSYMLRREGSEGERMEGRQEGGGWKWRVGTGRRQGQQ